MYSNCVHICLCLSSQSEVNNYIVTLVSPSPPPIPPLLLLYPLNSLPPTLAPSAVTNLVPTSNPFSICVQWAEPIDNGGQPIEQYRVELWNRDVYPTENYVFVTDQVSSVLSYTIENLNNDTNYRWVHYRDDNTKCCKCSENSF